MPKRPTSEALDLVSMVKSLFCFICGSSGHFSKDCHFNPFHEKADAKKIIDMLLKKNRLTSDSLRGAVLAKSGLEKKGQGITEKQVKALIDKGRRSGNGNRGQPGKGRNPRGEQKQRGEKPKCTDKKCQTTGNRYKRFHSNGGCNVACIGCYTDDIEKGMTHTLKML